jgi:transcriptional regulator with XRE-family HTH domain
LKLLGLTQVQLAKRLNIATVTIEKFVNGDSMISEELALRISKETGLDFEQLVLNSEPLNPRRSDGTPLVAHGHVRAKRAETRRQRQLRRARVARFTRAVVTASLQAWLEAEPIEGGKLPFPTKLRIRLDELVEQFGLKKRILELMGIESEIGIVFADIKTRRPKPAKSARKPKRQPL